MYRSRLNKNLSVLRLEILNLKFSRFPETKGFIQHGNTTVYKHCIAVAYASCVIAAKLNIQVNIHHLVRGALLHDYFLYDWHVRDCSHRMHGFTHPKRALFNASHDFTLSFTEQDIISKHMFPLTLVPPLCRESWIVTIADKYCALRETLGKKEASARS